MYTYFWVLYWCLFVFLLSSPLAILYLFVFVLYFPLHHSDISPVFILFSRYWHNKLLKLLSLTWYMSFFVLIQYYGYRLVSFGWLLRKRYAHTLVGVYWHTCTCTFLCIHLISIEICQTILKLNLKLKQTALHWMLFIPIAKRCWQRIRNGTNASEKVNTQKIYYHILWFRWMLCCWKHGWYRMIYAMLCSRTEWLGHETMVCPVFFIFLRHQRILHWNRSLTISSCVTAYHVLVASGRLPQNLSQ